MIILGVPMCLLVAAQQPYEPTSSYTKQELEHFTLYVSNRLLGEKKELGDQALALLQVKLFDINRVVPEGALKELHQVPIWVSVEDTHHQYPCMCYHPSREWLTEHGWNPDKAGAVEICNATNFLSWTHEQPFMVLHELAHAYNHRLWGYDNPEVKAAYEQAKASGIYESVLRYSGQMESAYALTNADEYFAELTEAFFGTNDFYPFVRAEVQKHDPTMFELLKKLWGA